MNKEIHWLLMSLNQHMFHLDEAEKAYPHLRDLNDEVRMWRKKYAEDEGFSGKDKEVFVNLSTNCFIGGNPKVVYDYFVKDLEND